MMDDVTPVESSLSAHLDRLRRRILAGDNRACYIERECILRELEPDAERIDPTRRYCWVLERLLARVSTPVECDDVFLGRIVEERWELCTDLSQVNRQSLLPTRGHLTLNWPTLLTKGLSGIAQEAQRTSERLNTAEARRFADNVAVCARAVTELAQRYAGVARERAAALDGQQHSALLRAAAALDTVPEKPAGDFFSALQSIWFVHLVTSCYIGSRDFAFGRLGRYLLPFYEQGIADGSLTRESAGAFLAHFLMKANEITGTATWNYNQKPIPCQSSKQYLMLAGRDADGRERTNELTELILVAATRVRMPQPVLTVCIDPECSERLKNAVASVTPLLGGQIQFYNDRMVQQNLVARGLPPQVATEYTMGGCCRVEIGGVTTFVEKHLSMVHWMLATLNGGKQPGDGWWWEGEAEPAPVPEPASFASVDDILEAFGGVCRSQIEAAIRGKLAWMEDVSRWQPFHFESLLLRDCVERGLDCESGGSRYALLRCNFNGIATVANCLYTIQRLVFEEKRVSLPELLSICEEDFQGHESLRQEIVNRLPKFGNGHDGVDALAGRLAGIVLDTIEGVSMPRDHVAVGGFYSLHNHHRIGAELPATPDGRLAGEPVSENQSPSYGTDLQGVTALLGSVARLPLSRTCQGGLNVTFGGQVSAGKIRALLDSFFGMGGLHVGFTFMDRETLVEAREHPERYRSLTVRVYGFSEYFVSLAPHEQQELIDRTRY